MCHCSLHATSKTCLRFPPLPCAIDKTCRSFGGAHEQDRTHHTHCRCSTQKLTNQRFCFTFCIHLLFVVLPSFLSLPPRPLESMSLQDSLTKFKQQQEKCQSTIASISARSSSSSKSHHQKSTNQSISSISSSPAKPPTAVKFSSDTERLQHINSVRKAPIGAQIKRVIDLLLETRQALTPEQINEACYVDINGNRDVFESLKNNHKVHYDGRRFSYKSKHDVKDKGQLLILIRKFPEGLAVIDVKDAYPSVMEDLQALKSEGQVWLLSNMDSQEDIVYPNDPKCLLRADDELKQLFRGIELPRDMVDIEKDLQKNGMKPATNTAKRRAMAQVHGVPSKPKPKKKKREINKRTKLTNVHLPELFKNLDASGS